MSSYPSELECPITGVLFVDPVMTDDDKTYERAAIQRWFDGGHRTSPATNLSLPSLRLRPNRLLASLCEAARSGSLPSVGAVAVTATVTATPVIRPFKSQKVQVGARKFVGRDGKNYLQLQAHVPPMEVNEGADYIFAVDHSGSMETPAWVKVDKGQMGITRLNLVKQVIRTMAAIMGPQDRVAIVAFNNLVVTRLPLTPMDTIGREALNYVLNGIVPHNCTNIYGAVEEAARIASSPDCKGRRIVGLLLTDGVPTESLPPLSDRHRTMPMIQERVRVTNPWSFHTMGFSSDINSTLLEQMAAWGQGRFLFVPSGDMVSTNGINLTAYEKTVASLGTHIVYTINGVKHELSTGPIASGQRRDFVFPIAADATLSVTATEADSLTDFGTTELSDCRRDFTDTLTYMIDGFTMTYTSYSDYAPIARDLDTQLMAFYTRHATVADPSVKAILRDVASKVDGEGQCRLALSCLRPHEWGLHYLRAYRDHMRAGICMNFKDPGLKIFETPQFLAFQALGDTAFTSIPPPPVERKGDPTFVAAPVTAAAISYAFNNSSGSCFQGQTLIRMADNSVKAIQDIRPSDSVFTPSGPARVVYRVTFHTSQPSQPLVQFTPTTGVTPWHPCRQVLADGTFGPWSFPADLQQFDARPLKTVYNLVLDIGHIIESGSYQFVTLGHGLEEGILKHEFFGTDACIKALEAQPGSNQGLPVYLDCVAERNEAGLIVGWKDDGFEEENVNGSSCNIV
jgi:hypothetical protein